MNTELSTRTLGDWLEYWGEKRPTMSTLSAPDCNFALHMKQFDERVNNLPKA